MQCLLVLKGVVYNVLTLKFMILVILTECNFLKSVRNYVIFEANQSDHSTLKRLVINLSAMMT